MKLEERLKVALQSKSHVFDVGKNEITVYFEKLKDGSIADVSVGILPVEDKE